MRNEPVMMLFTLATFETTEYFRYRAEVLDRVHEGVQNGYIVTNDIEEYIQRAYCQHATQKINEDR